MSVLNCLDFKMTPEGSGINIGETARSRKQAFVYLQTCPLTLNYANMPSGSQLLLCLDNGNHSKSIYIHSNWI